MDSFHILNFHPIFSENAFCLSQRLCIDIVNNFNPIEGHTYIVFGGHERAIELSVAQTTKIFKYIIINSEPPLSQFMRNKYYISLMKNNIVFDYHELSTKYLTSLGIRVFSRYTFEFVYQPKHDDAEKDIDIFFCGTRTPRREAIYNLLKKTYPDKCIVFHFDWKFNDQYQLTRELHRVKYLLNIPYHNHEIIESHRIHKGLACGCEVVSLFSGHKESDDFYQNYVHMTHDLIDFFQEENPKKKLGYSHLVTALSHNTTHNKWIVDKISDLDKK